MHNNKTKSLTFTKS